MKQIYVESYYRSGYSRFMQYFNDMLDHPKKETIEQRIEIIKFFDDYGAEATRRAFGKARSTVFLWKQKLKKSGGKLSALAPRDKTPIRKRKRLNHPFFLDFILKYRADHPGTDKTTITPVLAMACQRVGIKPVSESTVGRIIHDFKEKGRLPKSNKITINARFDRLVAREQKPRKKKTRRKGFLPQKPGISFKWILFLSSLMVLSATSLLALMSAPGLPSLTPINQAPPPVAAISSISSSKSPRLPPEEFRPTMAVNLPSISSSAARKRVWCISSITPSIPKPTAIWSGLIGPSRTNLLTGIPMSLMSRNCSMKSLWNT